MIEALKSPLPSLLPLLSPQQKKMEKGRKKFGEPRACHWFFGPERERIERNRAWRSNKKSGERGGNRRLGP